MEIKNFDKLVKIVTENLLGKLELKPSSVTHEYSRSIKLGKSCLILVPNRMIGFKNYLKYIFKNYSEYNLYLSSSEEFSKTQNIESISKIQYIQCDIKNKEFMLLLEDIEAIMLLGPKISQLKALTENDDSEDVNHILLEGLMTNKAIMILLNANAGMLDRISPILKEIKTMGISVSNIQTTFPSNIEESELITEKYVMRIKELGLKTIYLNKKQVITPLAKDKLSEYKIKVEYVEEAK